MTARPPAAELDAIMAAIAKLATRATLPRLTLEPDEAAYVLGVSRDFFDEHVKPEVRVIRRGRKVLVAVRELERWADASAERVL